MKTSTTLSNIGDSFLTFSTGEWAKQADGSVTASYGDTMVLATVCMSKDTTPGRDFFPLTVEYQERTYAMGKIPGGFFKREGKPRDKEILTSRLIDRPLRPLFPEGLTNEVQIIALVLSSDGINDPDILSINASSCALSISNVPFDNPVGAVRVSKIDGNFVINPTYKQRDISDMDLVLVGTQDKIVMIEAALFEISEEEVLEAIKFAQPYIKQIIAGQKELQAKVGKTKKEVQVFGVNKELLEQVRRKTSSKLQETYGLTTKDERQAAENNIIDSLCEELVTEDSKITRDDIKLVISKLEEESLRRNILEKNKRPDGRGLDEIRTIDCKVGNLPCTHGSAVFTRGETQSLSVVTLGTSTDEQRIESLEGEMFKKFMLHYNFPPFSVGEVKFMRGPSRRDLGHGTLAEKAITPVLPSQEKFPYTIRVVSDILESNGSSSMATTCAASLSLMDAGVPVKGAVAGIAIGLVTDKDQYKILTDIAGAEDHYGDMDFKVAGTKNGITAIQLDTKIAGITFPMIEDTLNSAKKARLFILEKMIAVISSHREELSKYAPKIKMFPVNPEKIGVIIGPGGKTIKRLQRENNSNIDIDDETNMVSVSADTTANLERTVNQVMNLVRDVEVGEIYEVKVEKIVNFGAFCEIAPGKSGLVHVSELADEFVKDVSEHLKEGDIVLAKVIGIDPQGKIKLSIKQAKTN